MTTNEREDGWSSAWLDLVAFLSVLAIAWWTRASATDLVWSLWLSSLVVGYAIIVWAIFRVPLMFIVRGWSERGRLMEGMAQSGLAAGLGLAVVAIIGVAFALAFFTVHFGGFHFVHASFLDHFFPLVEKWDGSQTLGAHRESMYREVLRRYWIYLPAAFLAERAVFLRPPAGSIMGLPYLKVMRMHALIFFFGFAHFLRLDNFAVYAVVYAVYFFPWRLIRRPAPATQAMTA